LVLVVGENVVDFGMVVLARNGILDEREKGLEVGRRCRCAVIVVTVDFVAVFCCWLVGSRVPSG